MVNAEMLREKIRMSGYTIQELSQKVGIDTSTFYRKIKAGEEGFSVGEARKISEILNLNREEVENIFFASHVAQMRCYKYIGVKTNEAC